VLLREKRCKNKEGLGASLGLDKIRGNPLILLYISRSDNKPQDLLNACGGGEGELARVVPVAANKGGVIPWIG